MRSEGAKTVNVRVELEHFQNWIMWAIQGYRPSGLPFAEGLVITNSIEMY